MQNVGGDSSAKNLDSETLHIGLYQLAFLRNDGAGMAEQVAWSKGNADLQDFLWQETKASFCSGHLRDAEELFRRAAVLAHQNNEDELVGVRDSWFSVWEAFVSNFEDARKRATAGLSLSTGRYGQPGAALALAITGDQVGAQNLLRRNPAEAVEILAAAEPYELWDYVPLYPVYLRGQAYLRTHRGSDAAREFQAVLDHRGIVVNDPIGALAHLGLARAYTLSGDTTKARSAYQDFLTLWRDADPDIPILNEAKTEYAKLE